MDIKDVYVGQRVKIVQSVPKGFNWDTFSVYSSDRTGVVLQVDSYDKVLSVYIKSADGKCTWGRVVDIEPVDEVIRVDCHKPNIFKRVCMYLRGKI